MLSILYLELLWPPPPPPLQYSCLENPMGRGAWWAAVHGVAKSQTRLSDFTFTFHFYALEKEMATHSGVLAWRIPGRAEPGGLLSVGSHRVGHNWSNLAVAAAASETTFTGEKGAGYSFNNLSYWQVFATSLAYDIWWCLASCSLILFFCLVLVRDIFTCI